MAGGERGEILLGQGPNIAAGASCIPAHVHLFILKNCSEKKTCQYKLPVFSEVEVASYRYMAKILLVDILETETND